MPPAKRQAQSYGMTAAGWDIFTVCLRTKEKSCPPPQHKAHVSRNTWSTQSPEDIWGPKCSKLCADNRKHIWALSANAAHVVSSGKASVSKTQITLHIWLLPQHELPLPLHPAQVILSHPKCLGGNHREALIPFPKITSTRGKGQGGRWSLQAILQKFQISWHWPP